MTVRGKLFLCEGVDAAGKATHSKLFTNHLQSLGRKAVRMSFPNYTTMTGKAILGHLKGEWTVEHTPPAFSEPINHTVDIDALVFQSLMTMNRYEVSMDMDLTLHNGTDIVLDRYWPSGYAYGLADGLPEQWLIVVHEMLPPVDCAVLLDIPPEESVRRRPERRDRYEKQAGLMETVRGNYKTIFADQAAQGRPWTVVDALGTKDEVQDRIRKELLG